jgi:hypothetical protein
MSAQTLALPNYSVAYTRISRCRRLLWDDEQTGSYRFVGRISTDKRASVDRTNQLRDGRQPFGEVFPRLVAAMKT